MTVVGTEAVASYIGLCGGRTKHLESCGLLECCLDNRAFPLPNTRKPRSQRDAAVEEPQEAPIDSLGPENTVTRPSTGPTNNMEEHNQRSPAEEKADVQKDHGRAAQSSPAAHSQLIILGQSNYKVLENNGQRAGDQVDQAPSDKEPSPADDVAHEQTDSEVSGPIDRRISGQTDHRLSSLAEGRTSGQVGHRLSGQVEMTESEQIDRRLSSQPESRTPEQVDHRLSSQPESRTSGQVDHRLSSQPESRTSGQVDHRLSSQPESRTSEQVDHRLSSQAERRTSEQVDHRLSSQVERTEENDQTVSDQGTSKQIDHKLFRLSDNDLNLSDEVGQKLSVKSLQTYDQTAGPAGQLALDQTDRNADQLPVVKNDNNEQDQVKNLVNRQTTYTENYLSSYETLDWSEDRLFSQFSDVKEDRQAGYRTQPHELEASRFVNLKPELSVTREIENATSNQAFSTSDAGFTSNLQAEEKLPFISSKHDLTTNQQNAQATEIRLDDFSGSNKEKPIHEKKQTYKRNFPVMVYEDPYQLSLQYMEKHNILQIFQRITENLVFEKPEDPLHFMLCQVQEMIRNRTERKM